MHRVAVPQLFENMEEATLGKWLVAPGQTVAPNQPLCELITEKTTLELPAESEGTVRALTVGEKAVVPTGFIIALIGSPDEELPDVAAENAALKPDPPLALDPTPAPAREDITPSAPTESGRLRATPAARRAAKVAGVALEEVAAQFPGKVLSEDDVKQFAAGASAEAQ